MLSIFAYEAAGEPDRPAFPAPSFFEGRRFGKAWAESRCGDASSCRLDSWCGPSFETHRLRDAPQVRSKQAALSPHGEEVRSTVSNHEARMHVLFENCIELRRELLLWHDVIASAAKRSSFPCDPGSLRRNAPRDDGGCLNAPCVPRPDDLAP